jgi:hypothetical protein
MVYKFYVTQMGSEDVICVRLAQDKGKRPCLVNVANNLRVCEISGFRCEVEENLALLGFIQRRYWKTKLTGNL